MMDEIQISSAAAEEAIRLIEEYLFQGGSGFDAELLDEVRAALSDANRIVIGDEEE